MGKDQFVEINNLKLIKIKYKDEYAISGTDLCRRAGYKNPDKVASQIYSKNKDFFPSCDADVVERTLPDGSKYRTIARSTTLQRRVGRGDKMIRIYNKPAAYFFVSLMRTEKAKAMTQVLMDTFSKLEKALTRKANAEWKTMRASGKATRLLATDGIQILEEYAEDHGSQNANRYYATVTKMVYKELFGIKDIPKSLRDTMSHNDLKRLIFAEGIIKHIIEYCVDHEVDYHDIYKIVKDEIVRRDKLIQEACDSYVLPDLPQQRVTCEL